MKVTLTAQMFVRRMMSLCLLAALIISALPVAKVSADSLPNTGAPQGFALASVADGLDLPTTAQFSPDGRIFVAQKDGQVKIVKNGQVLGQPFYTVPNVNNYGDRGLLGLALDPNFATNSYVYLLYTYENNAADAGAPKTGRLIRITASGDSAVPGSEQIILGAVVGSAGQPSCQNFPVNSDCLPADSISHAPASMAFGPDNKLYVSLGDASSFDDVDPLALRSQNLDSFAGKVLRINTDGTAPVDNPYYNGNANNTRSKIYALGMRNPFRFSFRPSDGMLVLGDVGWDTWEEINTVPKGANLGWPCYEGYEQQNGSLQNAAKYKDLAQCQQLYQNPPATLRAPLHVYPHPPGSAVVGGLLYGGSNYPAQYKNRYFYGDYAKNQISSMNIDASGQMVPNSNQLFASNAGGPVAFFTGPSGDIYYVGIVTGAIYHITYSAANQSPIAIASADKTSGPAPLTVTFTSSGSTDPEGDALAYGWDFGDGSAVSTQPNPTHTFTADGTYLVTLTVADEYNHTTTKTLPIYAGQTAPTVTVASPASNTVASVGQTINFSGSATDAQDDSIPPSRLSWRVTIQHCPLDSCHVHTLLTTAGTGGSFTFPAHDGPYYLQVSLTATDTTGLASTQTISVYPQGQAITHALQFDGINDYAMADNPGDFMLQQFTAEAMIKTLSVDTYGADILSMGNNWTLRIQPGGSLLFSYNSGGNWYNTTADGINLIDGIWHHVAVTRTAGLVKLYVDGVLRTQAAQTRPIDYIYGGDMIVGRHGAGDDTYTFNGAMDEIRFWATPRSDTDITRFHATTLPANGLTGSVAYYAAEQGTGSTAADTSPTGAHLLRLMSGTSWTTGAPLAAPATTATSGLLSDTFTGTAINTTKWQLVGAASRTVQNGLLTMSPQTNANAYFGVITKNAYDLTASGALVEAPQVTNPVTTAETQLIIDKDPNNQLILMRSGNLLYLRQRTNGAVTDTTLAYNATTMRWWQIRESGGQVFFDTAPDGLTWTNRRTTARSFDLTSVKVILQAGTYTPTANPGSARFDNFNTAPTANNALFFNGTTAKATVEPLGLYNTQVCTAELWAKVQATGTFGSELLSQGNNYGLRLETDGTLTAFTFIGNGNWKSYRLTGVNLKDNAWHHIAVTKDAATVKIYLDAALRATYAATPISYTMGGTLALGQHPDNTNFNLTGQLDEIRLWNIARTQAQIQADWKREINPQPGLVGYWQANETGSIVNDVSGGNRPLTLTAGVTRSAGFPKQ